MKYQEIKFAAYVYPAWHPSGYRRSLGQQWTEWELIKSARPLYPGHKVVEKPLWGYYDDSDSVFVEKQIRAALKYHIDIFVFSYYWNKKPVLNEGIDKGFLRARNNKEIQFALIWSPRLPRLNLPLSLKEPDNADRLKREIKIDEDTILQFINFCKNKYFIRDNYLKINNQPVLYFFQYYRFLEALGGNAKAKVIFERIDTWYPIITNFELKTFKRTLKRAIDFIKTNKISPQIVHISSWNEWSEGNHLEPGKKSGFKYLKAVKNIYENYI